METICDYKIRVVASDGHDTTFGFMIYQIYNQQPYQRKPIYTKNNTEANIYVHLDQKFDFTIASGTFKDQDERDILQYASNLGNGVALPSWLLFNTEIQRYNGIPRRKDLYDLCANITNQQRTQVLLPTVVKLPDSNGFIDNRNYSIIKQQCVYTIIVEITDEYDVIYSNFTLIIYNHQPYANYPIYQSNDWVIPYSIHVGETLDLTVSIQCFKDLDPEDYLQYTARALGNASLPGWLQFNAENQRFQGVPVKEAIGINVIEVLVSDSYEDLSQTY